MGKKSDLHKKYREETDHRPNWPTALRETLPGGIGLGIDAGEVWMWRSVPLSPVRDVTSMEDLNQVARPLREVFDGLADLSPQVVNNRKLNYDRYRQYQMLLVNVPRLYRPSPDSPIRSMLIDNLGNRIVPKRLLMFGVKLVASTIGKQRIRNIKDAVRRAVETVSGDLSLEHYQTDMERIAHILDSAGFLEPSSDEFSLSDSWWNLGRHNLTPFLPHSNHLHVFNTTQSLKLAEKAGYDRCDEWTIEQVPGRLDLTFAAVTGTELAGVPAASLGAMWVQDLLDEGALAISIRGRIEPMKSTRNALIRQEKAWNADEAERREARKAAKVDQADLIAETHELVQMYDRFAPPSSVDTSVLVAFDGRIDDFSRIAQHSIVTLSVMEGMQSSALTEMMMCSRSRQNPARRQWPVQVITHSGIAGLTTGGDQREPRALLGFSENDRQPIHMSPIASSRGDFPPLFSCFGATGSGKQMVLSTVLPTPTGPITMGEVAVGNKLLWRGGGVCTVTALSPIDEHPRLFRVTIDDGQQLVCDGNHQFIASDRSRVDGADVQAHMMAVAEQISALAVETRGRAVASVQDVFARVSTIPHQPWCDADHLQRALDFMDAPRTSEGYQLRAALGCLAARLHQRYGNQPGLDPDEQVVTVDEMIACDTARWGLRLPAAVERHEQRLPTTPYELGQQLARNERGVPKDALGYSIAQRIALVRAIVDTCGSVHGPMRRIKLPNSRTSHQVLRMIRSLGIKATELDDGSIDFITTMPGLRAAGGDVPEDADWLYVTSITPVTPDDPDYEPARCITVDSPDASYLVADYVPTHNTMLLQWLASQWSQIPTSKGEYTPVVVINPKMNSDLTQMVEWSKHFTGQGQVSNLDRLLEADGMFDPIRFSKNPEVGIELATEVILSINPFGTMKADFELPLIRALRVGVADGATCIGEALRIASTQGAESRMIQDVLDLASTIPKARALIGMSPHGQSLSVAGGLTLIQAGQTDLVSESGLTPDLPQRVNQALLRMIVQGSAASLAGRDGVVLFDEAWVFAKGSGEAIGALGRTAREMRVLIGMFNQRPSEMLEAGLENYNAQTIILYLPESEARAALKIARLPEDPVRLTRITNPAAEWGSLKAVFDPITRQVNRGSVGIYVGLDPRPINTEIVIPQKFFQIASTNAKEKDAQQQSQ